MNSQKIIKLQAENVKKLKAIEITPTGEIVGITGKNGQGKSSILDSICMALGGKSELGKKPIRNGEDKAKIVLELNDYIITRSITESGSTVKIASKDGMTFSSPQTVLDKFYGDFTFDPLAFTRMKPAEQLNTLRNLVGIDFADLNKKREELFTQRTIVNRESKSLENQYNAIQFYEDAPSEIVDVSKLMTELSKQEKYNIESGSIHKAIQELFISKKQCLDKIKDIDSEIQHLINEKKKTEQYIENLDTEIKDHQEQFEARESFDTGKIKEQITNAQSINQQVMSNQKREAIANQLKESVNNSKHLSENIDKIDNEKLELLSSAKFPIDGMTFDEDGIFYNSVPFEQCSSAEQLKVSVAMGMAINPLLRVLLIRDGSLLDNDSMDLLYRTVKDNDYQLWIERAGNDESCQVLIEDGAIVDRKDMSWRDE